MDMWLARTVANWTLSLALTAALVLAPAASAFAACPAIPSADMELASSTAPCETPCKDCSSDAMKNACKGDCVCVKTMIIAPGDAAVAAVLTAKLNPEEIAARLVLVRPPDTPPPRSLLA